MSPTVLSCINHCCSPNIFVQGASLDSLPSATLSDVTSSGGGGVTVSEVTSPMEPTAGAFPGAAQQLQASQIASSQGGLPPSSSVQGQQLDGAVGGEVSQDGVNPNLLVSDVLTPTTLRLVPGLGDIATMPISEILATSTQTTSLPVSSEPIITQPASVSATSPAGLSQDGSIDILSPTSGLVMGNETISNPSTSLELIPKGTNGGPPHRLQRALSTEEIEQK